MYIRKEPLREDCYEEVILDIAPLNFYIYLSKNNSSKQLTLLNIICKQYPYLKHKSENSLPSADFSSSEEIKTTMDSIFGEKDEIVINSNNIKDIDYNIIISFYNLLMHFDKQIVKSMNYYFIKEEFEEITRQIESMTEKEPWF